MAGYTGGLGPLLALQGNPEQQQQPQGEGVGRILSALNNPEVQQALLVAGLRLMQKKPYWQSNAGHAGVAVADAMNSVAASRDYAEKLRQARTKEQLEVLRTENELKTGETNRTTAELNRKKTQAELDDIEAKKRAGYGTPEHYQELRDSERAARNRKVAEDALRGEREWTQAEENRARADYLRSQARASDRRGAGGDSGKPKKQIMKLEKTVDPDTGAEVTVRHFLIDGTPSMQLIYAPIGKDDAQKIAEKEYAHIKPSMWNFKKEDKDAYEDNVKKRVQQLTKRRVEWVNETGEQSDKPPKGWEDDPAPAEKPAPKAPSAAAEKPASDKKVVNRTESGDLVVAGSTPATPPPAAAPAAPVERPRAGDLVGAARQGVGELQPVGAAVTPAVAQAARSVYDRLQGPLITPETPMRTLSALAMQGNREALAEINRRNQAQSLGSVLTAGQ